MVTSDFPALAMSTDEKNAGKGGIDITNATVNGDITNESGNGAAVSVRTMRVYHIQGGTAADRRAVRDIYRDATLGGVLGHGDAGVLVSRWPARAKKS